MFTTTALHKRTVIIPLMVLLLLSLSSGIAASQPSPEERSSSLAVTGNNDYATCTDSSPTLVVCDLKIVDGQSSLDLISHVMLLAKQINSAINTDTVMWIHAYGGGGGRGSNEGPWKAGDGGFGGYASTITTIDDYQARYGTTTLHYYFGGCCYNFATAWNQGGGGASTIVASVASGFTADNVLLVAGGGGGGSSAANFASGRDGGNGGSAIATTANATYHAGQDIQGDNDAIARGGSYSGPGIGSPIVNPSGNSKGGDGFGGWGGGTVLAGGDSRTFWLNGDPGVADAGHGLGAGSTPGAAAGGGYGGGGMNACGGDDGDIHHDCAAAGGGSYATGITRYDSWQPTTGGGGHQAAVRIAFHTKPGGTFSFAEPVTNPFGLFKTGAPTIPIFVDIDGNGTQDLFVTGIHAAGPTASEWFYFKNTGTPSEPAFTETASGLPVPIHVPGAMAFVDIDDDGDFDLFYNTSYFENTGSATHPKFVSNFSNGISEAFGLTELDNIWSQTFADIDSDGDYDAFAGTTDGHVHYFQNVGSATKPAFAAPVDSPFGIEPVYGNAVPAFVDNNSDGNLDVIVGSVSGSVGYRQNLGSPRNPAFGDQQVNPFGLTKLTGSSSPAIVDINADGQPDVFFGNGATKKLLVQLNDAPFVPPYGNTSAALAGVEVAAEPVPRYEAEPLAAISVSSDSTMQTATIFGSENFDASQVSRDVITFEDWSGAELATIVHAFWSGAVGDVNGDGYLDQTLIFHSEMPELIADEVYHGKEFCIRGVTVDGTTYEACAFAE